MNSNFLLKDETLYTKNGMLHIMERNRRIKVNIINLDSTLIVFIYFNCLCFDLSLPIKKIIMNIEKNSSDVCLHLYSTLVPGTYPSAGFLILLFR
jgi:hypothetical protein